MTDYAGLAVAIRTAAALDKGVMLFGLDHKTLFIKSLFDSFGMADKKDIDTVCGISRYLDRMYSRRIFRNIHHGYWAASHGMMSQFYAQHRRAGMVQFTCLPVIINNYVAGVVILTNPSTGEPETLTNIWGGENG